MKTLRVLLAGNPNVGKSTVFNALTGLHQHTGNWPGKTVSLATGQYEYKGRQYELVDLPGTYSLESRSQEEQVARQALDANDFDCVVVVCDGTCLRRNLILVYQILSRFHRVVVLVNLLDEVARRGMQVNCEKLEHILGVPVVPAAAGSKQGMEELKQQVRMVAEEYCHPRPRDIPQGRRQRATKADETAKLVVSGEDRGKPWQLMWDQILTGRKTGIPVMLLGLFLILWITISAANVPSAWLWQGVQWVYRHLYTLFQVWDAPWWLTGALLDGMLLTAGRVVAVMLPPMAIFFPLFTLLEDLGYLPRVAYNLDHCFQKVGGCGKMGLTMCMGLGCNAVGVTGCRIIESPRERIMAVVTNSLVPCNGRFGGLILLLTAFLIPADVGSAGAALGLTGFLILSFFVTMGVSKLLSVTLLRGMDSGFVLELPPYRKPRVGQVLVRSILDRTLFVLGRAAVVALPAGLILWILGTVTIGGVPLLQILAEWLDPVAGILGLSGTILLAFLLGTPANELVLPLVVLIVSGGFGFETEGVAMGLEAAGVNWEMALCTAVFFLFHWPCATTILTIRKETGSRKWTALAVLLPTVVGAVLCMGIHLLLG